MGPGVKSEDLFPDPSGMASTSYSNMRSAELLAQQYPPSGEYRNPPQGEYQNPPQSEYRNPPESVYGNPQSVYQDSRPRGYQPSAQGAYQHSFPGGYQQSFPGGYQQSNMSYQQHGQAVPVSESSRYPHPLSFEDARTPAGAREYSEDGRYPGMCMEVVSDAHLLRSFPSMASCPASTVSGGGLPRTHSSSGSGTTHSSNGSGGAAFSDVLSQDSLIEDDRDDIERRRVLLAEAKARADAVFEQRQAEDQSVRAAACCTSK